MQPPPLAIMAGTASLQGWKAEASSPRSFCWKPSQGMAAKGAMGKLMLALSTRISTGPRASAAFAKRAFTWAASRTSAWMATARPPPASMALTTSAAASAFWA